MWEGGDPARKVVFLLEQKESNLISQWVVGIGLQMARKGVPGRKEWLEERTRAGRVPVGNL